MAVIARRIAGFTVAVLLSLAALGIVAFCLGALVPRSPDDGMVQADGPTRRVLLLSSPIHTDFALPADPDVVGRFSFLAESGLPVSDPAVRWIVAGRGGRAFYLETPQMSDIRPGPVLKAITVDRAAMHMELAGEIPIDFPSIRYVDLDEAAFERLLAYIEAGFARDPDGARQLIAGEAYGEFDRFYEANGWFNALLGCNTWTAAGLRYAGLNTGLWNPLPLSLFWSLEWHNPERIFQS